MRVESYRTATTVSRTRWGRLHRPAGLVAQTRWLFLLLALASVLLTLPSLRGASGPVEVLAAAVAYAGLVTVWVHRYRSGRCPVALGALEAVLILVTAAVAPATAAVFTYMFATLWSRSMYGSARGAVLHAAFVAAAMVGALVVRDHLPNPAPFDPSGVAGVSSTIPTMFLTVWVGHHLLMSMRAREQAQLREAALVQLGHRLIGVTDGAEIVRIAGGCAAAICAATPGLRLVTVLRRDGRGVVVDHYGDPRPVPRTLPLSVLPADPAGDVQPLPDVAPLRGLAAPGSAWLGVPLADDSDGWILLGSPEPVPDDVVVAVSSMINLVALARRTSVAHHDLATQASEDSLTGLVNRGAFLAAVETAIIDPQRRVALLFLDLDDFKNVNDGLGHSAGDELLCHVAARLRAGVRDEDLCARLGGDEFAVLLRDADEDASEVAQRLVELVAAPVLLGGRLAQVGASAGLAFAAGSDASGEQLVQQADVAMYAAKAKGKNRVQVFDPGLLQEDGRVQFEAELAAAAGAGQLVVHYQPIVSVDDARCVAVEALVRWQHPTRGLLLPDDFIATAEQTGAIVGIGEVVLRRACVDAARWSGPGGPLDVHVNVSAAQLTGSDFVGTVRSCTVECAIEPSRLVMEITEGMVLDSPAVRDALDALTDLGVAIAIDDFGTGYSALSTLRSLPLSIVKIDKSFLAGGPSRAADEAVVEAIVQMAGRLGLRIVAEGVERVDQQQFLRSVGAGAAQGYLHLRPTSAPGFEQWLDQQNAAWQQGGSLRPLGSRRRG